MLVTAQEQFRWASGVVLKTSQHYLYFTQKTFTSTTFLSDNKNISNFELNSDFNSDWNLKFWIQKIWNYSKCWNRIEHRPKQKTFQKMLKLKIDILPALFALVRVRQSKDSIPVEDRFVEGVVLAHLTIGFVNHWKWMLRRWKCFEMRLHALKNVFRVPFSMKFDDHFYFEKNNCTSASGWMVSRGARRARRGPSRPYFKFFTKCKMNCQNANGTRKRRWKSPCKQIKKKSKQEMSKLLCRLRVALFLICRIRFLRRFLRLWIGRCFTTR